MLFNFLSLQLRVPEYPTMGLNGILWHYGYIRPANQVAANGGFQDLNLGDHDLSEESSEHEYSEDEELDNASNEAQNGSAEDEGQAPAVDHNANLVVVNGPVGAEGSGDSLGSSPECSLE